MLFLYFTADSRAVPIVANVNFLALWNLYDNKIFGSSSVSRRSALHQGILKGEVSLYHWPPVWLVWNQLYDDWHECNGRAHFEKCKWLFEYQNLLLLNDILWLKLDTFNCCLFFEHRYFRHLWQLETAVFQQRCLMWFVLLHVMHKYAHI